MKKIILAVFALGMLQLAQAQTREESVKFSPPVIKKNKLAKKAPVPPPPPPPKRISKRVIAPKPPKPPKVAKEEAVKFTTPTFDEYAVKPIPAIKPKMVRKSKTKFAKCKAPVIVKEEVIQ